MKAGKRPVGNVITECHKLQDPVLPQIRKLGTFQVCFCISFNEYLVVVFVCVCVCVGFFLGGVERIHMAEPIYKVPIKIFLKIQ